jgi:hypothetical protein
VRTYQVERKKKNDLADRLIKMAICCVAIISVVVMAAYGTKNSKGHLRGVGSLFGSDDSSDYGKYTLEVITVWNDNHARPKIGEQIDMWIAKENYMTVLSKFTEGKNSLDAFRSIYKEHLGKARVVDVSENEFNPKIRNMEDKLFRNVLLYESMSEYYSNAAEIPISVRGIKEEAYVKYEVTISMEKELIKKLEENGVTIHPSQQKAFSELYGFTNDAGGILTVVIEGHGQFIGAFHHMVVRHNITVG